MTKVVSVGIALSDLKKFLEKVNANVNGKDDATGLIRGLEHLYGKRFLTATLDLCNALIEVGESDAENEDSQNEIEIDFLASLDADCIALCSLVGRP